MSVTKPTTAREYLRVSKDQKKTGRSVSEQHGENAELAAEWGTRLHADPYVDDGIGAYRTSPGKRKDFDQLVADLRSGAFTEEALWLWEISRLSRELDEWSDLRKLLRDKRKLLIVTDEERIYVPWDREDEADLADAGTRAVRESIKKSKRQRRAAKANALAGKPSGGGMRAFGFARDGSVKHDEFDLIAPAALDVLAGVATSTIAKRWNEAGVRRPFSERPWNGNIVAQMLRSPHIAGLRTYQGEPVEGITNYRTPAVDPVIWRQVRERLSSGKQGVARRPYTSREMLGTGRFVCGGRVVDGMHTECGMPIYSGGNLNLHGEERGGSYHCDYCGLTRRAPKIDALVIDYVAEMIDAEPNDYVGDDQPPTKALARSPREARRVELNDMLSEAMQLWHDKAITGPQLREENNRIRRELREIEDAHLADVDRFFSTVSGSEAFRAMSVEQQREIVDQRVIVTVHWLPRGHGGRSADLRIDIEPRVRS